MRHHRLARAIDAFVGEPGLIQFACNCHSRRLTPRPWLAETWILGLTRSEILLVKASYLRPMRARSLVHRLPATPLELRPEPKRYITPFSFELEGRRYWLAPYGDVALRYEIERLLGRWGS